jgi:hypothetical protein
MLINLIILFTSFLKKTANLMGCLFLSEGTALAHAAEGPADGPEYWDRVGYTTDIAGCMEVSVWSEC